MTITTKALELIIETSCDIVGQKFADQNKFLELLLEERNNPSRLIDKKAVERARARLNEWFNK